MSTIQRKRKTPKRNAVVTHATERVRRNTITSILNDFIPYNMIVVKHYMTKHFIISFLISRGEVSPQNFAGMVKLAATIVLGTISERSAGSSPVTRTKQPEVYANWSEATGSDIDQKERSTTCLIW